MKLCHGEGDGSSLEVGGDGKRSDDFPLFEKRRTNDQLGDPAVAWDPTPPGISILRDMVYVGRSAALPSNWEGSQTSI